MRFDTTLKEVFQMKPRVLMGMLAGSPIREFVPAELVSTKRREPDLLMRLENGHLAQIELQVQPDRMGQRMLAYRAEIREVYEEPLLQIVLYVGNAPQKAETGIRELNLDLRFEAVHLGSLDAGPLMAEGNLADVMLSLLCRNDRPRESLRLLKGNLGPRNIRPEDMREKVLVLSSLRHLERLVLEEFDMPIRLEEVPILREAFEQGEQKGEKRGEKRGQEKGRRDEAAANLEYFLDLRFGPLPEPMRSRIRAADFEQIHEWMSRLKAGSLDEIFRD